MLPFALNHMTVARVSYPRLLELAAALGCTGVEVRNDLASPLFDGLGPGVAGRMARDSGLRLLAVAELGRFDDWTAARAAEAAALIGIAAAAGAEAVSLIPRNDGRGLGNGERQANLRVALKALAPMLSDHGLTGLVEPLGFATSSLRHKSEAVAMFDDLGTGDTFRLVHDTFHHALAGGEPLFADWTGLVHVSGVTDPAPALADLTDAQRGLVDVSDRLGTAGQVAALAAAGYAGPVSVEAFAPAVHASDDPEGDLAVSFTHLRDSLARAAA